MDNDLAVHGGLKNGTPVFKLSPQEMGIHEVAIMRQGVVFIAMMDEKGLGVGDDGGGR